MVSTVSQSTFTPLCATDSFSGNLGPLSDKGGVRVNALRYCTMSAWVQSAFERAKGKFFHFSWQHCCINVAWEPDLNYAVMWKKEAGADTLEIAHAGVQTRYIDHWNERNAAFALNQANIFGQQRPSGGQAGVLTISPTYQKVPGYNLIAFMAFTMFSLNW